MTKQTHTPGPWRIGNAGATIFGPPNGKPSPETVANLIWRKNADLIAAAPDLLAALVKLTSRPDPDGPMLGCIDGGPRFGEMQAAWVEAEDAIAKARGEA